MSLNSTVETWPNCTRILLRINVLILKNALTPSSAPKAILAEVFLGGNLIWDSTEEIYPQARWGSLKALQWDPAGRVRSSQQSWRILKQEVTLSAGEKGLLWVDWKCCHIVSAHSRRGTSELPVTSLWPRLQLVLGYFLSQITHLRRAALLSYSETRARSSLIRQRSYAVWIHC